MCYGEQPAELSEADLADLDGQAMREKIEKLTGLGVVKVVKDHDRDPAGKFVDLKEVLDWRYRNDRETSMPHCCKGFQDWSEHLRYIFTYISWRGNSFLSVVSSAIPTSWYLNGKFAMCKSVIGSKAFWV